VVGMEANTLEMGRPLKASEKRKFSEIRPGVQTKAVLDYLSNIYDYREPFEVSKDKMMRHAERNNWSKASIDAARRALIRAYGRGSKNKAKYDAFMEELHANESIDNKIVGLVQDKGVQQSVLWQELNTKLGIEMSYQTFVRRLHKIADTGKVKLEKNVKNCVKIFPSED
jgi:hypothetical protein